MQSISGASTFCQLLDLSTRQPFDIWNTYRAEALYQPSLNSWSSAFEALLQIRKLDDEWDGEGSLAPDVTLIDGAITLGLRLRAKQIPPPDHVHVSVNGTLYFEWHDSFGYVEIEMVTPVDAECRILVHDSNETEVFSLCCR